MSLSCWLASAILMKGKKWFSKTIKGEEFRFGSVKINKLLLLQLTTDCKPFFISAANLTFESIRLTLKTGVKSWCLFACFVLECYSALR